MHHATGKLNYVATGDFFPMSSLLNPTGALKDNEDLGKTSFVFTYFPTSTKTQKIKVHFTATTRQVGSIGSGRSKVFNFLSSNLRQLSLLHSAPPLQEIFR